MIESIVSTGVAIGCIYALIGITYNVMFSASRVFSFTAGTLGMLGGVLGSLVIAQMGLPLIAGFLLVLAAGALSGIITEIVAVRPVLKSLDQHLYVLSTLALALMVQQFTAIEWGTESRPFPRLFDIARGGFDQQFWLPILACAAVIYFLFAYVRRPIKNIRDELRRNHIHLEAILRGVTGSTTPTISKPTLAVDLRDSLRAERAQRMLDMAKPRPWWRRLVSFDRNHGAPAQLPFEPLGEKGAAEELNGPAPAASTSPEFEAPGAGPMAGPASGAQEKPAPSPADFIPSADAAYRQSPPQAKKTKSKDTKFSALGIGSKRWFSMRWVKSEKGKSAAIWGCVGTGILDAGREAIRRSRMASRTKSCTTLPCRNRTSVLDG